MGKSPHMRSPPPFGKVEAFPSEQEPGGHGSRERGALPLAKGLGQWHHAGQTHGTRTLSFPHVTKGRGDVQGEFPGIKDRKQEWNLFCKAMFSCHICGWEPFCIMLILR